MTQQIDSRTIFVSETPCLPVFEDRPEPRRVEDVKLNSTALKTELGLTSDAELEQVFALTNPDFPKSSIRVKWGSFRNEPVWSKAQVLGCVQAHIEKAQNTLRLLGASR